MSAERRRLIVAIGEAMRAGGSATLCTLVRAEGSSYRRPGARLLLHSDGGATGTTGTISGGCLEGDLVRRAGWLTRNGPVVQHYSTAFDDTAEVPYGLGCGGELDLLLEPTGTAEFRALAEALEASQAGAWRRVMTGLPAAGTGMWREVRDETGAVIFRSEGAGSVGAGSARLGEEDGADVFVEDLLPPQRLVLFGAGDDAAPMVGLGHLLGWHVVVADGRRQMARPERFPEADQVVVLERPGQQRLAPEDAVVLMTHSYEQDRALLVEALRAGVRYLGLLGAKHRSCLLVSEAAAELGWTVAACCERLHAPVGLDLGGDGPEAIALAVIAEIQSHVQGRPGGSRRLSADEVEAQVAKGGTSAFLQARCALDEVG